MPCGCGNNNDPKKDWVYTNTKGEQKTFRSEIEARAAQVRAGGGGTIK